MLSLYFYLMLLILSTSAQSDTFRDEQLQYPRVQQAYSEKEGRVLELIEDYGIRRNDLQVYIRAFKAEKELELWAKNSDDQQFRLIRQFAVCKLSGELGPKRQQGDKQVPEGFYHIDRFNPKSNYHLSLGINYPNAADQFLGVKGNLGGDIFIHGDCVTIGCLPITDDLIKELYVFCVEAKTAGQRKIPVHIFPAELTDENFIKLKEEFSGQPSLIQLWTDLKKGFDYFQQNKKLPVTTVLQNGRYQIN